MSRDPIEDPRAAAIEQLERFGLSGYAARTFVALASLGEGTARDVSRVSDVPRTRVYDAVDELHERGFVDVQRSSPMRFWAVSGETAIRAFDQEYRHRTGLLATALGALEPVHHQSEQRGVWTVDGQEPVTQRVLEFLAAAQDEIVYMTVEDLLTDDVVEGLHEAADRGVSIRIAGLSPGVQNRIQTSIPGAEPFDSLWLWSDSPAGRLMMVDREKTLVSVLVNGPDRTPSDPRSETAIWGEGEMNSLVVVLRAIFAWRLGNTDE